MSVEAFVKDWEKNPMRKPKIAKVVVNFGVGTSGPRYEAARTLIEKLIDQKPVETRAKQTQRGWGITKNQPVGLKVTLRGDKASKFLKKVLWAKEDVIYKTNFDNQGNLSLGIKDHLDLPETRYDPRIGSHGFDINVVFERPGYRVQKRRRQNRKIPGRHRISKDEGVAVIQSLFEVTIEEKQQKTEDYW